MLRRLTACLALVAVCCSGVQTVAGVKITGLDREVRLRFYYSNDREGNEQPRWNEQEFSDREAFGVFPQVAVNHQLVVVTETYKFLNDGKSAADSLLLCSTTECAEAQAYQEVVLKTHFCR